LRVTLIRHGEAADDAPRDELRSLTLRGRSSVARVGRALRRRGGDFTLLVSSPYVRALQTAEIIAASVGYTGRLLVNEALVPEGRISRVVSWLATVAEEDSVALVAHEPILSALAAALLGVERFPALRKGEALRLRLPEGPGQPGGELRWRIDPETGSRETR
jgi:phosphohistidine phosphatase